MKLRTPRFCISAHSLHDALPISTITLEEGVGPIPVTIDWENGKASFIEIDRKSTRLNSSHSQISYAVFCLKKKTTLLHLGPVEIVARQLGLGMGLHRLGGRRREA